MLILNFVEIKSTFVAAVMAGYVAEIVMMAIIVVIICAANTDNGGLD